VEEMVVAFWKTVFHDMGLGSPTTITTLFAAIEEGAGIYTKMKAS
jgi:hypothetical protein